MLDDVDYDVRPLVVKHAGCAGLDLLDFCFMEAYEPCIDLILKSGQFDLQLLRSGVPRLFNGIPNEVDQLVTRGADINIRYQRPADLIDDAPYPTGYTALHHACVNGNVEVARLLLNRNCSVDPDITDDALKDVCDLCERKKKKIKNKK